MGLELPDSPAARGGKTVYKEAALSAFVFLLVLSLSVQPALAGETLASDSIDVTINVEVIQRLQVIEPAALQFDYPWDGAENGEPLVFEDVGAVEVKSNADWLLQLQNSSTRNFDVLVRPNGSNRRWEPVESSHIQGSNGRQQVSFDLKVRPLADTSGEPSRERVELGFTLQES